MVRPKDTVSSIAKQYGVSVGDVLRWNSLAQQSRIRPGDRLRVATRPSVELDGHGGFRYRTSPNRPPPRRAHPDRSRERTLTSASISAPTSSVRLDRYSQSISKITPPIEP